jgi:multidrug efflux pump subunit AcrB
MRTNPDGSVVRISDVGRTELGTEQYDVTAEYNGKPAGAMAIRQAAGANALETAQAVREKLEEMSRFFPARHEGDLPLRHHPLHPGGHRRGGQDPVRGGCAGFHGHVPVHGHLRATLIPTIAVPVVLLGTFAVLGLFGFSINMLTMFAMVLAIGLLVDDAIVVVENVERIMAEEGLPPGRPRPNPWTRSPAP